MDSRQNVSVKALPARRGDGATHNCNNEKWKKLNTKKERKSGEKEKNEAERKNDIKNENKRDWNNKKKTETEGMNENENYQKDEESWYHLDGSADRCVCSIRLKILFYFASTSVNQPENSNTPITDTIKAHPAVGKDSSRCLVKSLSQTT